LLFISILSAISALASDNVLRDGNKTLLVLGDSLSAGYGVTQASAWVSLLQTKLTESRYPMKVVNASVSGETSVGGLNRISPLLQQYRPSIVIVELGANDGLRGLPISAMKENLHKILQKCLDANANVLLLGMRLPPNYGPAYTQSFADAYKDLAFSKKITLIPFFLANIADKRELMQADDLHPNQQAQPLILDNVWPSLLPMIQVAMPP